MGGVRQKPRERVVQADGRSRLVEARQMGRMPDVVKVASLMEWAGVAFGSELEVYQLQLSLKHLAASSGAQSLRFWGKIFGSKKDYYVAEGFLGAKAPAPGADKHVERRGDIGAN